jgi:hypothetical protein
MTDDTVENSVKLAQLCGWQIVQKESVLRAMMSNADGTMPVWCLVDRHGKHLGVADDYDDGEQWLDMMFKYNLYHEQHMALAWRVLNWAGRNLRNLQAASFIEWWDASDLWEDSPTEAVRLWLDKILELATEAELV